MAKKLSTLVVPVKLDTSGMNAGLSEMRSKMSRVRGSGGGGSGGAMGGSAPGFASGVVPFGVGGGSSSAASAMAAAFGASLGRGRESWQDVVRSRGGLGFANKNVAQLKKQELTELRSSTMIGRGFMSLADWARGHRDALNRRIDNAKYAMSQRPHLDPWMKKNNPYVFEMQRQAGLWQKGINYSNRAAASVGTIKQKIGALDQREDLGAALGAAYAGVRTLQALSPVGIQSTLGDLKPFESRAAGQYDIAQGMRNRAMTATTGNLTMGQQFLLGAGTEAGGGVTRTEQMGQNLYESLGTIVGGAGMALEKTLSSGIGFVEGALQRAAMHGSLANPMNYLRQLYN